MSTRIQLNPNADITIQPGASEQQIEVVIADPSSETYTVIEMTPQQLERPA